MEIVIGYQGKNHVTAGQVGRIMAGMAGSGTYVLETQNRLAATVVTANQVRVDTGDLVMQGRVATVETPETLTIESGVTGQKRRDLIVARYTMEASTAVEGIELAVVKGTPVSYGEPSDPEVSEGSILDGDSPVEVPLYRVTVDGLAPGTPEALLETVPSVDSLRDSVSRKIQSGKKKVTPRSDGWAMVWTHDQFVSEFGIDPAEATIVFCNYASGYSSIWPEPAVVDADKTVWSLIVWRTDDGWVASISEPTEIPIRYTVIS